VKVVGIFRHVKPSLQLAYVGGNEVYAGNPRRLDTSPPLNRSGCRQDDRMPSAFKELEHRVPSPAEMLEVALEQARLSAKQGGIPIGAALFGPDGTLLGKGHNERVQTGDPSMHAETAAFRSAGRRDNYRGSTMVTTLAPCWYCCGLIRQFGIPNLLIGEDRSFSGHYEWLELAGVSVTVVDNPDCYQMMQRFTTAFPALWAEDIGDSP